MKPDSQLPDAVDKSPEQLLAPFAKSRIAMWIIVAVVLHVVLIGGTSLGYIRDHFDPAGAEKRKAAALAIAEANKPKPKTPPKPVESPATNNPAPTAATPAAPVEPKPMDNRNNTPVVKTITATAATNEIPKVPDDLGININDTNRK